MNERIAKSLKDLFNSGRGTSRGQRIFSYFTWATIATAFIGAVFAAFGICTGGCSEAQNYRFFGLHFAAMGIPFFLLLAISSFGRNGTRAWGRLLYDTLLAGALGAEWIFLGVQGKIIKHYCPVCVGIAIAVFIAVALRLGEGFLRRQANKGETRGIRKAAAAFAKSMVVVGSAYAGLVIALVGISAPAVDAGAGNITQDIWLGKADSHIEVMVVGDWFCPYCRKVEPTIEAILPEVGKVAKYTFIDDPIHRESYAFIPANMSLLLNSKAQYLAGRKALLELAERTSTPSEADMVSALKSKGIDLKLADDVVLKQLARSESGFLHANAITLTPSLVVRNSKTGVQKVLVGVEEITEHKIADMIASVAR